MYCVDVTHSHALDSFVLGNIVNIHSFGLSYNSYGVRATTDRLEDGYERVRVSKCVSIIMDRTNPMV